MSRHARRTRALLKGEGLSISMSIADEIEKLDELRRRGVLSHQEFELAKRRLVAGPAPEFRQPHGDVSSAGQLHAIRQQNEIALLDRQWELDRQKYLIAGHNGVLHIPNKHENIVGSIVVVVFGGFWTIMAADVTAGSSDSFGRLFPLFGILFMIVGIAGGLRSYKPPTRYEEALKRYEARCRQLMGRVE